MFIPGIKQHSTIQYQFLKYFPLVLLEIPSIPSEIRYLRKNAMMYKVIGIVIYCFYEWYLYFDYVCLYQDTRLKLGKTSKKKIYDNIYVIGIPDVLMNLIPCCGFSRDAKSTIILTCCIKMVLYYLLRIIVIIESRKNELNGISIEFKEIVH